MKAAVTVLAASIVTVQALRPVQAPLQPANVEPEAATAVSVTLVPASKSAEQVAPQLTAPTLLVTVPDAVPDFETVRVKRAGGTAAAVTDSTTCGAALYVALPAWSYFTEHVPVALVIVNTAPELEQAPELE